MKSKKLQAGLLISLAVLLSIVAVVVSQKYEQSKTTTLAGESQALRDRARDIEARAPSESAPIDEKLAYYDQLVQAKRASEDHKGAVAAFEKRLKLSDKGIDYLDYLHIALSYQAIDQKQDSLSALDRAEKLLPSDSPDGKFLRSEVLDDIIRIRSELQ